MKSYDIAFFAGWGMGFFPVPFLVLMLLGVL